MTGYEVSTHSATQESDSSKPLHAPPGSLPYPAGSLVAVVVAHRDKSPDGTGECAAVAVPCLNSS